MPDIKWSLSVHVAGGPKIATSSTLAVDAYDEINVKIEAGADGKEVEVQPGDLDDVQLLFIRAQPFGDELTYKVNDASNPAVKLNGPQVLAAGAVGLLADAPTTLLFSSELDTEAAVQILVGRNAT